MKKSLLTIAVLSLMGGQAFAEQYSISQVNASISWYGDYTLDTNESDILYVDTALRSLSGPLIELRTFVFTTGGVDLHFLGQNVFASESINLIVGVNLDPCNLSADDAAQQYWAETFSAFGGGAITLMKANVIVPRDGYAEMKFMGACKGENFTLNGANDTTYTGTFVGYIDSPDDLKEDEVGWSLTHSTLTLYGKLAPEPATATLSLLALVGLAARRRRK